MNTQQGYIGKTASSSELLDYTHEQCAIPDAIKEVINIITASMQPHEYKQLLRKEDWRKNKHSGADEVVVTIFLLDHTGALRASQHKEISIGVDETRRERLDELVYENISDYLREFDFDTILDVEDVDQVELVSLTRRFVELADSDHAKNIRVTRKYGKGFGLFYALREVWDTLRQK